MILNAGDLNQRLTHAGNYLSNWLLPTQSSNRSPKLESGPEFFAAVALPLGSSRRERKLDRFPHLNLDYL